LSASFIIFVYALVGVIIANKATKGRKDDALTTWIVHVLFVLGWPIMLSIVVHRIIKGDQS